jgi:hypothetical protein
VSSGIWLGVCFLLPPYSKSLLPEPLPASVGIFLLALLADTPV